MNTCKILGKCQTHIIPNWLITRNICVTASTSNIRWRLENGYPRNWTDRGTLTDGVDFSYIDGKPSPYTSGQRARLLRQKEFTERIIYLLNGIKFANQRKEDRLNETKDERDVAMTRKLKWKGIKGTNLDEEFESSEKKVRWKKPRQNDQEGQT